MCNAVPVASKTGFSEDIICHGENGFLFEVGAPVKEICVMIEEAYRFQGDIRKSIEHLTWENYAKEIFQMFSLNGAF